VSIAAQIGAARGLPRQREWPGLQPASVVLPPRLRAGQKWHQQRLEAAFLTFTFLNPKEGLRRRINRRRAENHAPSVIWCGAGVRQPE
jgi:hypothetical protein